MNPSVFYDRERTQQELLKRLEKLTTLLERVDTAMNQTGAVFQKDSYQLLVHLLKPTDAFEKMIYGDMLKTAFQLEIKCHGSGYLFLHSFAGFAREYVRLQSSYKGLSEAADNQLERYWAEVLKACTPASYELLERVVDKAVDNDVVLSTTVREAVRLAGVEGTVTLEETDGHVFTVSLQYGYNFPVKPFNGFVPKFGTYERHNAKVLLVDGVVEKVSELDSMLRKAGSTGVPVVIVAQGFDEEVVATLYTNMAAGRLDVVPVKLEQSLETLNFLNDIAAACDADVVSTLKGESLVFVDFDLLPTVDKVSLTGNVLTVHNNRSRARVCAHLNYLEARRQEENTKHVITDVSALTTKRMQNLQAHVVKIGIPKSLSNKAKPKIDNAVRSVRSAMTYGFYDPRTINTANLDQSWVRVHKELLAQLTETLVPSTAIYLALMFSSKLAASYFTAAGAVMPA